MQTISEYSCKIKATLPGKDPTKKQPVFYNPKMASHRNLSLLLLNSLPCQNLNIALPLAGSGIRGLRFLKELKSNKIKTLHFNDLKPHFPKIIKENLKLNKIKKTGQIKIFNQDASLFLLNSEGFDYIDLDPFGSPNRFLPAAIQRISRKGILAVTATDTAALTGTYLSVTKRKYWAHSLKNYLMHETGLRILIRKVQLQGIQFDKALTPLLAYHKDHYFRIYFRSEKGRQKCHQLLKQHQYLLFHPKTLHYQTSLYNKEKNFLFAGPLWTGKLFDRQLLLKMKNNNPFPEEEKFLQLLTEESRQAQPFFYDLHALAKAYKKQPPKLEPTLKKLDAVRTHFSPTGFKTKKNIKEIINILKNLPKN